MWWATGGGPAYEQVSRRRRQTRPVWVQIQSPLFNVAVDERRSGRVKLQRAGRIAQSHRKTASCNSDLTGLRPLLTVMTISWSGQDVQIDLMKA